MPLSYRWRLLIAAGLPALVGLGGTVLSVKCFSSYGWSLFLGLPVLVSFLSSLIYCRTGPGTWAASYGVSLLAILGLGCLILVFAIDGFICLLMALPLAAALALLGSTLGYLLGKCLTRGFARTLPLLLTFGFPFLVGFESHHRPPAPLHEVTTRINIPAPIQSVWNEVIAFDRIRTPPSGIFRCGIAYPIQARINGTGKGAIRHCIFSTGPFIEPITKWEAPHLLEFDVTSNPPAMKEFSPWGHIDTPHLHGTFNSEHGRFRLYKEGDQCVLEGTTWYRQTILPDFYWHVISGHIIHQIHLRVLEHIKRQSVQKIAPPVPPGASRQRASITPPAAAKRWPPPRPAPGKRMSRPQGRWHLRHGIRQRWRG